MKIKTKIFGEIEIADDRIISFPSGIIGFPELTEFALLHDEDSGSGAMHWMQSLQEPAFAMPGKRFCNFTTERGDKLDYYLIYPAGFDPSPRYPVLLTQYSGPGSQQVADRWGGDWETEKDYMHFSRP